MDTIPTNWTEQNETEYQLYMKDFDPSPIGYGDDYLYPPDRYSFLDMKEEGEI